MYESVPTKKYILDADGCANSETRPAAQVEFSSELAERFNIGSMASQPESLN